MEPTANIDTGCNAAPSDQSEVVRFLAAGAGRGLPARRIDTHGAIVFLIGDRAFKMKRAVRYDYMDLSTLKKRHALLQREYDLNRPAAPVLYLGLRPVVRRPGGDLALGGAGEVVEWVLEMARFEADAELIHIARAGGLDDALAARLGTAVARYHVAAPVRRIDAAVLVREILDELDRVFGAMATAPGPEANKLVARARRLWATRAGSLTARTAAGHVRRCHGDLHLRNLVMLDGEPTPFDALEFDERLGTCDTLYDLAFLLMDLDHLGLRHAANLVLNAWLQEATPDLADAGLPLLPLYLSLRAAIRAMVDLQGAAFGNARALRRDARAYLDQARGYLAPNQPLLVAIGGLSGSGKTTLARALAHRIGPAPGAVHLRSDVLRKTLLHRDPMQRLGPEGYAPDVTARTYGAMRDQARAVLAQGHGALLDAVHAEPAAREAAERVARDLGCRFVGIWLDTPTDTRAARVAARGPDASDADAGVVHRQARVETGTIDWHRIGSGGGLAATTAALMALVPAGAEGAVHHVG